MRVITQVQDTYLRELPEIKFNQPVKESEGTGTKHASSRIQSHKICNAEESK